jgi:hypothetical protein
MMAGWSKGDRFSGKIVLAWFDLRQTIIVRLTQKELRSRGGI